MDNPLYIFFKSHNDKYIKRLINDIRWLMKDRKRILRKKNINDVDIELIMLINDEIDETRALLRKEGVYI